MRAIAHMQMNATVNTMTVSNIVMQAWLCLYVMVYNC